MTLKIWNAFFNRHLFNKTAVYTMVCSTNVNCIIRQGYWERSYFLSKTVFSVSSKLSESHFSRCEIKPLNNFKLKKTNRHFSSDYDNIDFENVDLLEDKLTSTRLRNFLYPNTDDPVIIKLNECTNVEQLFDVVNEYKNDFNSQRCAQTVLLMWDFQKLCRNSDSFNDIYLSKNELFQTYMNQLKCHDMFLLLLELLNETCHGMNSDALSCTILYLTRMGVDFKNEIVQNLCLEIDKLLDETKPGEFPVTALSRYVLALNGENKFFSKLQFLISLTKVLPHVEYYISNCENVHDFKLVSICIHSLQPIMTTSLLEQYHNLTDRFLESNQFHNNIEDSVTSIIKAVSLFSYSNSRSDSLGRKLRKTLSNLLNLLVGNVDKLLHFQQLFYLQKLFIFALEPVSLEHDLKQCCSLWVDNSDLNMGDITNISPELLFCLVMNTLPSKQYRFTDSALQLVDKTSKFKDLLILSTNQLRPLTSLSKKLWPKLKDKLSDCEYLRNVETLSIICLRYMEHVNQNRDRQFEKQIMVWLLHELKNSSAFYEPKKLARCALFLLSFPEHFQYIASKDISFETFVQQLLNNIHQFSNFDCLNVSRGFPLVMNNSVVSSRWLHHYARLDTALTSRSLELLEESLFDDPSLFDLNVILRSYIFRKGAPDSHLLRCIVERYKNVKADEISSRSLRNAVYNLHSMSILIPELMDKFCDYIVSNSDAVIGSTVSKLLYTSFILGYYPKNESFSSVASNIVSRDVDKLSGLVLLQAALSLSSLNSLTDFLIKHIFTIEFLDQLDDEIKHGYSKYVYPARIKKSLMELNRCVCLDYPEARVPWFHAKFCQQEAVSIKKLPTSFSRDVYDTLLSITRDSKLIQHNIMSSYGHNIDFQLCLNSDRQIVPYMKGIDEFLKLAIVLYTESDFTINVKRLKGKLQMRQRHLEMLGYKVVQIDQSVWNSMYMAEPKAKQNYLNELIKNNVSG